MPRTDSPWLPKSVLSLRDYNLVTFRHDLIAGIFRLRNMTAIDATGMRVLEEVAAQLRESGRAALFCGAPEQPRAVMQSAGFPERVGEDNVVPHVDAALARARFRQFPINEAAA